MKTKNILIVISFLIVSLCLATIIMINSDEKFYLDEEYYNSSSMKDMYSNKLQMFMNNKDSFALFIYDSSNEESKLFESILNEFIIEKKISFYKTTYYDIENAKLNNIIEYVPSVALFNKGKVVDCFKYDAKDKTTIKEDFTNWFIKHVKLKEENEKIETTKTPKTTTKENNNSSNLSNIKVNLPNVKRDKGKVNIYLFWGNGCPHCEKAFDFFNSIDDKYKEMFNLYDFETWKDKDNKNIKKVFAYEMEKEDVSGVPYIIIGSKSFKGFGSSLGDTIKKTIEEESQSGFDIYFDVIKDKYKG